MSATIELFSTYTCIKCGVQFQSKYFAALCNDHIPASVYVYQWREEGQPYPFYCGTGSYSRCFAPHINNNNKLAPCEIKRRELGDDVIYEILYEGLDRNIAEEIEYGLIRYYLSIGVALTNVLVRPPLYNVTPVQYRLTTSEPNTPNEIDLDTFIVENPDLLETFEINDETDIQYPKKELTRMARKVGVNAK